MPIPLPHDARLNHRDQVELAVELDGVIRRAAITIEAVKKLHPSERDPLAAVRASAHVTRLVAELLKSGGVEPITITSRMLDGAGQLVGARRAQSSLTNHDRERLGRVLARALRAVHQRADEADEQIDAIVSAQKRVAAGADLDRSVDEAIAAAYAAIPRVPETEDIRRTLRAVAMEFFKRHL